MDRELAQFVQATLIASDPSQASLHEQALEYLSNIEKNAHSTWQLALTLFLDTAPDGGRKYPSQSRFFALRVLDGFLDNRFEPLDNATFQTLQQSLLGYIQSEYIYGSSESSATFLRNKFSHTLTLFFLATYVDQWPTFFIDLFSLMRPAESSSQPSFNPHLSLLLFHIVLEISGEVADQIIKSARQHSSVRHARDARVRDAVRERDAVRINEAVLTIVVDAADRMTKLQKGELAPTSERESTEVIEVVDWGIRTFGSYVGWIDINLTVTPTTVPLLFSLLSDQSLAIRLAASVALLRILSKGLKEPEDKLQLIKVLSLGQVLEALEEKTRTEQANRGEAVDEGEESYREALGRLLNVLGLELMKLVDECPLEDIRSEASRLLNQTLTAMLHFMADDYDDTCSTIFPMVQTILASYKRSRKTSSDPVEPEKRSFLTSLLGVIFTKMKWEEDTDVDELDDEDRGAFESLRKDLRSFVDSVLFIDQDLVTDAVRAQALDILNAYSAGVSVKWNDAELAIYLVYIFGEINKTGGKGRSAFCKTPVAVAKEKRKETDYSTFPLTTHGEMIYTLIQSGISAYPHRTVVMQFFETVVRYSDFFKVRKECILPTLQSMVDTRGLHNPNSSVQSRVFYLFHRFVKESRNEVTPDLAGTLLEGVRDILAIQVELPELESPEQDLLAEAIKNTGSFDAQLYLFETVGTLVSLFWKSPDQPALLLSFVKPLLDELSVSLQAIKGAQDVVPILKVHHTIMALGNIAKGFPEYPSPLPEGYTLPPLDVFQDVAQAILMSLAAMNVFKPVRDATRFAFARILATTGPSVTRFIPPLMANLLAHFELSELVDFMNFINLLIHKLQQDLFDVLNELIGPLSAHITGILSQPVSGTDDELSHAEIKKAYLALLNNVVSSKLHGIFISDQNKNRFEPLLENMLQLAGDVSDPYSERAAFTFLGRSINVWGQPLNAATRDSSATSLGLQGFERIIYENIVPAAFRVLSLPEFNIKDGQILMVLHEIANLLQAIVKTRGQEAFEFFISIFLPAQSWPPETAVEFTTKMRDLDNKNFRKYFSDFVRASQSS